MEPTTQFSGSAGAATATPLLRDSSAALSEQLAARYAERIRQRLIAPGSRLPSVREGARRHAVSPGTIVAAYDQLQAQGLVQARPQRGFFVREAAPAAAAGRAAGAAHSGDAATAPVDATALIRSMFQAHTAVGAGDAGSGAALRSARGATLACAGMAGGARPGRSTAEAPALGTLPEAWLDAALLQRSLRRVVSRRAADWLRYGDPAGDPTLRDALVQRLAQIGIAAEARQIVTTVGATHALDLISRTLLSPGDAVLVDEPGWAVEFARLSRAGMKLLPVPRGAEGPDLAVLEHHLRTHRPRLYITVSVLHNPTGASISPAHAHRVLQLAQASDLTLVEDDTYAWLAPPHATRMAQLDGLQRTVYVSGFSKIVAPQWRVGFLAAPPALAEKLIDAKLLTSLTTPAVLEQAIADTLTHGTLRRHADRVTQRLAAARDRTARLVREAGCRFVAPPQGLFGWIDTGCDTEQLAALLLDQGWLTAPGALFHATRRPSTLMRVNFATAQDVRFWRTLVAARRQLGG